MNTETEKLSFKKPIQSMKTVVDNINGRVGVPILLYFLGVPGGVCVLLWFFIFRGK